MNEQQLRLGVVLSTMLVGAWLLNYFWEPSARTEVDLVDVLSVDPDEVQGVQIRVTGSSEAVALRRVEGEWRVVAPVDEPADPLAMRAFLMELAQLDRGLPVTGTPDQFGLEEPFATLELEFTEGSTRLEVGDEAPLDGRRYVRTSSGQMAAVWGSFAHELDAPLTHLRDQTVFRFAPDQVLALSMQTEAGVLRLQRLTDRWWLEGFGPASEDAVLDLLYALLNLRFEQRIPVPTEERLVDPAQTLTVELADETLIFEVGDATPMGRVVLRRGGAAGLISDEPLRFFGRAPQQLLVQPLLPYSLDAGAEIVAAWPDHQLTARRAGNGWVDTSGASLPGLEGALRDLRVGVVRDGPPEGRAGLELSSRTAEGEVLAQLALALDDGGLAVGTLKGGPASFWVVGAEALLEALGSEPQAAGSPDDAGTQR